MHKEALIRHVSVMQRLICSERLLSSSPQPAVVVNTVDAKENKKQDDVNRPNTILTPYLTPEIDPVSTEISCIFK